MTVETTRIWMQENRERWNEYQRNYYKRKKAKAREYQRSCRIRNGVQDALVSAGASERVGVTAESNA